MSTCYRFLTAPKILSTDGANIIECDGAHPTRTLDFWVLGLMLRGETGLVVGQESRLVRSGEYYLLPPHVRHLGTHPETSRVVIYFHFHAGAERCGGAAPGAVPLFGPLPAFMDYAALIRFLQRATDFGWMDDDQWNTQLAAILGQIQLAARDQKSLAPAEEMARATLDYLRQHAGEALDRHHLSTTLGYSNDHLDRVFRANFGITIYRKHAQLRLNQAAILLQDGRTPKEVASRLGFADCAYFLKAFKRERSLSPTQFQRTRQSMDA